MIKKENKPTEFLELKNSISKEIKTIKEIINLSRGLSRMKNSVEREMVVSQINSLKSSLIKTMEDVSNYLEDMSIIKPLPSADRFSFDIQNKEPVKDASVLAPIKKVEKIQHDSLGKRHLSKYPILGLELEELEKKTLKRLKKRKKKIEVKKERKASKYISLSNKIFGNLSKKLSEKRFFITLRQDLIKANMEYIPTSYVSVMFFTTLISLVISFFILLFLIFFSISVEAPFITKATEGVGARLLSYFWIIFAVPILTFFGMYIYPSAEKSYIENKINQELTFATIHMSAISQSMIEPSKIFEILIATKEYLFLEREFTKLINQVNVYGYDIVTSLRNVAFNSPSIRLTELLNGIATTIDSGGSLSDFFDKRANSLLFEYKIEKEKYTKSAETFMDIYISVVIAAPMIIMLLLIMIGISGLGFSLSSSSITIIMILGVTIVNILFLTFLHLKQTSS